MKPYPKIYNGYKNADFEAMRSTNPIADWLTECSKADPDTWTQIGDKREIRGFRGDIQFENSETWLYANYLQWCQRTNKTPFAVRRFKELVIDVCRTLKIT
jgi:putative DNA primase/helicase